MGVKLSILPKSVTLLPYTSNFCNCPQGMFRFQKRNRQCYFCIHGSVHRDSVLVRSNEIQQYAGIYLLQNYSTCFGRVSHPSSGVHQTVTAAYGTGHSVRATTFRQRGLIRPRWPRVVAPDYG